MVYTLDRTMKSFHIDFVQRTNIGLIWGVTVVVGVLTICGGGWKYLQVKNDAWLQTQENEGLVRNLQDRKEAVKIKGDPRAANIKAVRSQILLDLNPVFAVVENLAIDAAHLQTLQFDSPGNFLRLEYDVASLSAAAKVTEALNKGNENRPWKLVEVSRSTAHTGNQMTKAHGTNASNATALKATWIASLRALSS